MSFWLPSLLLAASIVRATASSEHSLQLGPELRLSWRVSRDAGELHLSASAEIDSLTWVGLGFSDYGDVAGADMCVMWRDWRREIRLTDVHVDKE